MVDNNQDGLGDLIKDFYTKYDPDRYNEEQVQKVREFYKDDHNALIKDFYTKYDPERYSEEQLSSVVDFYGLKKKADSMVSEDSSIPVPESGSEAPFTSSDLYRPDGSLKGQGFLGELPMTDGSGKVATEMTVGVGIGGEEMDIPLIVPTLTKEELDFITSGNDVDDSTDFGRGIMKKAVDHALERKKQGKPAYRLPDEPFAEMPVAEKSGGGKQSIPKFDPIQIKDRMSVGEMKTIDPWSFRTIHEIDKEKSNQIDRLKKDLEAEKEQKDIPFAMERVRKTYKGNLSDLPVEDIEKIKKSLRDEGYLDRSVEAAFAEMEAEDRLIKGTSFITKQYANEVLRRAEQGPISDGSAASSDAMDVVYTKAIADGFKRMSGKEKSIYEANQVIQEIESKDNPSTKDLERYNQAMLVRESQELSNTYYNWETGKPWAEGEAQESAVSPEELTKVKDVYSRLDLNSLEKVYMELWGEMNAFKELSQPRAEIGREVPMLDASIVGKEFVAPGSIADIGTRFEYNELGQKYRSEYRDASLKFKAVTDLLLLNKSPQDIRKDWKYFTGSFARPLMDVLAGEEFMAILDEYDLGATKRKSLDVLASLQERGVEYTPEELDQLDRGFGTHFTEMAGGLTGFMGLMYPANVAGKVAGLNKAISFLSNSPSKFNRLFGLFSQAALEELKFVGIAGGQVGMGSGLILGSKAMPFLNFGGGFIGRAVGPYMNSLVGASVGGTTGMELGILMEKGVESIKDNRDFGFMIEQAGFTFDDEMGKRIGAELLSNAMLGFAHVKSAKEAYKIKQDIALMKKLEGGEKEYTLAEDVIESLDKQADALIKDFEALEAQGKVDAAKKEKTDFIESPENKESLDAIDVIEGKITNAEFINKNEIEAAQTKILEMIEKAPNKDVENALSETFDKLENYEFTTETKTSTVTKSEATTVRKKTPRTKVTPIEERVSGKSVTTEDGARGEITIQERPDGKKYLVIEQKGRVVVRKKQESAPVEYKQTVDESGRIFYEEIRQSDMSVSEGITRTQGEQVAILGEVGKFSLEKADVNYDKSGNPVSLTGKTAEGKQFTIRDKKLAENELLDRAKREEMSKDQFETIYKEVQKEVKEDVLVEGKKGVSDTSTLKEKIESPKVKETEKIKEVEQGVAIKEVKQEPVKESVEVKPKEKEANEKDRMQEAEGREKEVDKRVAERTKRLDEANEQTQKRIEEVKARLAESFERLSGAKKLMEDGKSKEVYKDVLDIANDLLTLGTLKASSTARNALSKLRSELKFIPKDYWAKIQSQFEKDWQRSVVEFDRAKMQLKADKLKADIKELKDELKTRASDFKDVGKLSTFIKGYKIRANRYLSDKEQAFFDKIINDIATTKKIKVDKEMMRPTPSERVLVMLDVLDAAQVRASNQGILSRIEGKLNQYRETTSKGVKLNDVVLFKREAEILLSKVKGEMATFDKEYNKMLLDGSKFDRKALEESKERIEAEFQEFILKRKEDLIDRAVEDISSIPESERADFARKIAYEAMALDAFKEFSFFDGNVSRVAFEKVRNIIDAAKSKDAEAYAQRIEAFAKESESIRKELESSIGKDFVEGKKKRLVGKARGVAQILNMPAWIGEVFAYRGIRSERKLFSDVGNQLLYEGKDGVMQSEMTRMKAVQEYAQWKQKRIDSLLGESIVQREKKMAELNERVDTDIKVELEDGSTRTLTMSKAQAMGHLIMIKDPHTHKSYYSPIRITPTGKEVGHGFNEKTVKELESFVGRENVEMVERLMEPVKKYGEAADKVYIENEGVSGRVAGELYAPTQASNMAYTKAQIGGDAFIRPSAKGGHHKARVNRTVRYDDISAFDLINNYVTEQINYMSFSKMFKLWNSVFLNPRIKAGMENKHGKTFSSQWTWHLNELAGKARPEADTMLDWMVKRYTQGALGFNPMTAFKQLISTAAYTGYLNPTGNARFVSHLNSIPTSLLARALPGAKSYQDVNTRIFDVLMNHTWTTERKRSKDVFLSIDYTTKARKNTEVLAPSEIQGIPSNIVNTLRKIQQGKISPYTNRAKEALEFASGWLLSKGDMMPITVGGTAYVRAQFHRIAGKSVTDKIIQDYVSGVKSSDTKKFEQAVQDWYVVASNTQQNFLASNRAQLRVQNSFLRWLNAFTSSQYQYYMARRYHRRAMETALAKGNIAEAGGHVGAFTNMTIGLPLIFSIVNNAFRIDDKKGNLPEQQIWDVATGALTDGIPVIHQLAGGIKDAYLQKPWGKEMDIVPSISAIEDLFQDVGKLRKILSDDSATDSAKRDAAYSWGMRLAKLGGANIPGIVNIYDNWSEMIDESEYDLAKMMGVNTDYKSGKKLLYVLKDFSDIPAEGETINDYFDRLNFINDQRGAKARVDLDSKAMKQTYKAIYKATTDKNFMVVDYAKRFNKTIHEELGGPKYNLNKLQFLLNESQDTGVDVLTLYKQVGKYGLENMQSWTDLHWAVIYAKRNGIKELDIDEYKAIIEKKPKKPR